MSAYVKISTMEYPRHIGDIEIDIAGMNDYALVAWVDRPLYNPEREYCFEGAPTQTQDGWVMTWVVQPIPDSVGASAVRKQRNEKLAASDWTQVMDAPVDQAAWATYRQALRDISSQEGFPWTIEWPTQP